jgi:hypothetical protein
MRKIVAILSTALIFNSSFAVDIEEKINQVRQDAYKSGYEKGYLDAITKEKEKWIKEGEDRIINRLMLYIDLIERIFNYKVLLKNGKILPPQVALICDNGVKSENAIGTVNCEYKIVSNAKFIENPQQELSFNNLILKGKIEELVRNDIPTNQNIERDVYFVGIYDYEVGLDVLKRLYDAGYRTTQRNVDGKLAIAVLPTPDVDLRKYKKMSMEQFFSIKDFPKKEEPVVQSVQPVQPPVEKQIEKKQERTTKTKTGIVKSEKLIIRTTFKSDGKIIGYLKGGDRVEIIEQGGDWLRIRAKGKEGYVKAKYIEVEK